MLRICKSITLSLIYVLGFVIMSCPAYSHTNPSLCAAYEDRFDIAVALDGKLPDDYSQKELNLIRTQFNVLTPANCDASAKSICQAAMATVLGMTT